MYYVYILYSASLDKYYVGSTADVEMRVERHNAGWGRFTKGGIPWKLMYTETCSTQSEALQRERGIKRQKDRRYIEHLIQAGGTTS